MYRFFTDSENIDIDAKRAVITGQDVNHIRNVLRMHEGEEVSVMVPGDDREYRCAIRDFTEEAVELTLLFIKESNVELPCKTVLYQCLPKADKMETVITKAVELGAYRIVPVAADRCVVKLDNARADKKVQRWNAIAEAAAKQSKRAIIPEVSGIMTMREALDDCSGYEVKIIPYELADPGMMEHTRQIIGSVEPGMNVAVFIGPEGGFTDEEIELARESGLEIVTLGHRILRTETAGQVVLSWINYNIER